MKIVDPKPVLKALPKIFGHADKNVRAEASNLVVELYRWLREAIKTLFWNDLKPVQQQDLEKLFEAVKQEPPPKQERLLRSQQEAVAQAAVIGDEDAAGDGEDEEVADEEPIDLAEPKEILSKVPKDFQENMASTKWKDRKEALDALFGIMNIDRIQDGSYDEIVQILAKSMKDANVAVMTVAANCVEVLAKGLRKSFSKYRGRILAPMLERLKEKKQSVADALGAALDAVFVSSNLSDCLEDILDFLKHKNPQVKLETMRFLIRCLKTTRTAPQKQETAAIAEAATKLLTESTEVIRSGGAEILGTLMKIMGEKTMKPYVDSLDDIRKTKIKEYFEVAEVKAKDKPKPVAPPPKAAPPAQKRAAPGKKPALGLKKSTPRAPTPEDPPSSIYAIQKPAATRSIPSKLGAPGKSGLAQPSSGLKAPQKKLTSGSIPVNTASPRKQPLSPTYDETSNDVPPAPKLGGGLGGRGLASRPLGKPVSSTDSSSLSSASTATATPALNAASLAELEELRLEKDRVNRLLEDSRAEKQKLHYQITELQNHNAQLIEEHTRDRLQNQAKETQLVRARSDAENAQDLNRRQQLEMEKLRRELSRVVKASTSPVSGAGGLDINDDIYRDTTVGNGVSSDPLASGTVRRRPEKATTSSYSSSITSSVPHHQLASRETGYQRAKSYTSPSEEKENGGLNLGFEKDRNNASNHSHHNNNSHGNNSNFPISLGSPTGPPRSSTSSRGRERDGASSIDRDGQGGTGGKELTVETNGEPIENWKRAAEVTNALKARIEQMKVRR